MQGLEKKFDIMLQKQDKMEERMSKMEENMSEMQKTQREMLKIQNEMLQSQNKMQGSIYDLKENQNAMKEDIKDLSENQNVIRQDIVKLEKKVDKNIVIESMEQAMAAAYKKETGMPNVTAKVDPVTGDIRLYSNRTVVEEVTNEDAE